MAKGEQGEKQIGQLIERIAHLERVLRAQSDRLQAIEQKLGLPITPPEIAAPTELAVEQTSIAATVEQKRRGDLEARVGGSWFNRIGMLAIAIGVAFFLKYAFDNEWIGPRSQILIGIIIGAGFLIAGERMRAHYAAYAHGLSGGGILILYISIYAAFSFYQMIEQPLAFASMAGITVLAAFLAARYNALAIAILGLAGGFLTPPLLSTHSPSEVGLFGYITLLDGGVLALSYSRQWRALNYLSFAATSLTAVGYILFAPYTSDQLWVTIFFLTLFFSIFALVPILYNVVNRRPTVWLDLTLVFLNAVFYFVASYELLEEKYEAYLGVFALMVAAFYLALGFFTYNRDRLDRLLVYTFLGLAILFLVLAVPIQLRQHWVTMGWAIEGAVLVWVGLRAGDRTSRYAATAVFLIAGLYWALIDAPEKGHTHGLLMSHRAFSGLVLITALTIGSWLYEHNREKAESKERSLFASSYIIAANFLVVALFSLEAIDYFERTKATGGFDASEIARLENTKQLTLSALWTVYGTGVMIAGIALRSLMLRWMALVLLSATIIKVFLVDLASLKGVYRIISFVALGAILLVVSFIYTRSRQQSASNKTGLDPATD